MFKVGGRENSVIEPLLPVGGVQGSHSGAIYLRIVEDI